MATAPRYRKIALIGEGETCQVFRGERLHFKGSDVAIKELKQEYSGRRETLFRAAEAWDHLVSDGLLRVLDLDRERAWIVMPFMEGCLADEVRRGPLEVDAVRDLLRQALVALRSLHEQDLLHGNLKPSNVFRSVDRHVKLADGWCLSIAAPGVLPRPAGSLAHYAPEMLDSDWGPLGPATDMYSLGLVAWEALAGSNFESRLLEACPALATQGRLDWNRFHTDREQTVPPVGRLVPDPAQALAHVIDRMLRRDPKQRYHSAAEALADLDQAPAHVESEPVARQRGLENEPTLRLPAETPASLARRPDAPVLLRMASGPRAGEVWPLHDEQARLGLTDDCDYRLEAGREVEEVAPVELRLEADRWIVSQRGGAGFMINHRWVRDSAPLRSGDLVRLGPDGPDFQFILQPTSANVPAVLAAAAALIGHEPLGRGSSAPEPPSAASQGDAPAYAPQPEPPPPAETWTPAEHVQRMVAWAGALPERLRSDKALRNRALLVVGLIVILIVVLLL